MFLVLSSVPSTQTSGWHTVAASYLELLLLLLLIIDQT